MQVKFAFAASCIKRGGEASIGVAARAVVAPTSETAAIVTQEQTARLAVCFAPSDRHNENKKQAASRSHRHARPARPDRTVPSRTTVLAILPTCIGRARSSASRFGGTFSASVLPATQAMLEIGATILAGGFSAREVMSSALEARRRRVGSQAGSFLRAGALHDVRDGGCAVLDVVEE